MYIAMWIWALVGVTLAAPPLSLPGYQSSTMLDISGEGYDSPFAFDLSVPVFSANITVYVPSRNPPLRA